MKTKKGGNMKLKCLMGILITASLLLSSCVVAEPGKIIKVTESKSTSDNGTSYTVWVEVPNIDIDSGTTFHIERCALEKAIEEYEQAKDKE